ncbi:MAG: KEOPS complex subunit Pcc1 [Nitrosopumilaceae archaeon]
MSLTVKVQVVLNDITQKKADAIRKALEPDNVDFPENLSLRIENVDNSLVFYFQNRGNLRKLISTIDEVLEHVQVALKVID